MNKIESSCAGVGSLHSTVRQHHIVWSLERAEEREGKEKTLCVRAIERNEMRVESSSVGAEIERTHNFFFLPPRILS